MTASSFLTAIRPLVASSLAVALVVLLSLTGCDTAPRVDAPETTASSGAAQTSNSTTLGRYQRYNLLFTSAVTPQDARAEADRIEQNLPDTFVDRVFEGPLPGASLIIQTQADLVAVANDPAVDVIEADNEVYATGNIAQSNPEWALDRIDQEQLPLDNIYRNAGDGTGVDVYVLDTRAKADHPEYASRFAFGGSFVTQSAACESGTSPNVGHGTHVAGLIGGSTYGVAKNANLINLEVLNCFSQTGSQSDLLAAYDWIYQNAPPTHTQPAVVNLSLQTDISSIVSRSTMALQAEGFFVVTGAGNGNGGESGCSYSPIYTSNPARDNRTSVFHVAASDRNDQRWAFTNLGRCVDLFAPGVELLSSWTGSDTAPASFLSGTSMAAAVTSGAAATYLSESPQLKPRFLRGLMIGAAVPNQIQGDLYGTPNALLQVDACAVTLGSKDPETDPDAVMTARITEATPVLLSTVRAFRDEVMAESSPGQSYTDAFYAHTFEVSTILASNPTLWAEAYGVLLDAEPVLSDATSGGAALPPDLQSRIDALLESIQSLADEDLAALLSQARQDLVDPEAMAAFNISVDG